MLLIILSQGETQSHQYQVLLSSFESLFFTNYYFETSEILKLWYLKAFRIWWHWLHLKMFATSYFELRERKVTSWGRRRVVGWGPRFVSWILTKSFCFCNEELLVLSARREGVKYKNVWRHKWTLPYFAGVFWFCILLLCEMCLTFSNLQYFYLRNSVCNVSDGRFFIDAAVSSFLSRRSDIRSLRISHTIW